MLEKHGRSGRTVAFSGTMIDREWMREGESKVRVLPEIQIDTKGESNFFRRFPKIEPTARRRRCDGSAHDSRPGGSSEFSHLGAVAGVAWPIGHYGIAAIKDGLANLIVVAAMVGSVIDGSRDGLSCEPYQRDPD